MNDSPNPYAVTTLELADTRTFAPSTMFTVTRWTVVIAQIAMGIAAVVAWIDIESIVFSGPVMLGVGLLVTVLSWWRKSYRWFGIACLIFPVVVFLIIFLLEWSPDDAQIPIGILCTVFTLGMFGWVVVKDHEYRHSIQRDTAAQIGSLTSDSLVSDRSSTDSFSLGAGPLTGTEEGSAGDK